jgi:hypothetical protein
MNAPTRTSTVTRPTMLLPMSLDDRRQLNGSLLPARNQTMQALIGRPRATFSSACLPVTNPRIAAMMVTRDVGPFAVTGLRPAVEALALILIEVRRAFPDIHGQLGTAGMLCARYVRDSLSAISNHSWGTAIDLTVGGLLDARGDDQVQAGLRAIAPIFNRHGFFWGAGFRIEDAMHFEASDQLVRRWSREGRFGTPERYRSPGMMFGDRGPEIEALQLALNRALDGESIDVDGVFGRDTRAAVIDVQRQSGLASDGIVGASTRRALGLTARTAREEGHRHVGKSA